MVSNNRQVGTKIVTPVKILIFGGYDQQRVSLYTQVIIWVSVVLHQFQTKMILLGYESSCMIYKHECCQGEKENVNYPYPTCIGKCENPHYRYPDTQRTSILL